MAIDTTLFDINPELVRQQQQAQEQQAWGGSGYQALGYGLGRLFGAGNAAREQQMANAVQNQGVLQNRLFQNPGSLKDAYQQTGEDFLKMGKTQLGQKFLEEADKYRYRDAQAALDASKFSWMRHRQAQQDAGDEKTFVVNQVSGPQIKNNLEFLKNTKVGKGEEFLGGEIDEDSLNPIAEALAARTNFIMAEAKYGKRKKVDETQARALAYKEMLDAGVIDYRGENWMRNNYAVNPEKLSAYLGTASPEAIQESIQVNPEPKKMPSAPGGSTNKEAMINVFLKNNPALKNDRKKAEEVLKAHGKL